MNRDMKIALFGTGLLVASTLFLMVDVLTGRATVTTYNAFQFLTVSIALGFANRALYITATGSGLCAVFWFVILVRSLA